MTKQEGILLRSENAQLKAENAQLKAENVLLVEKQVLLEVKVNSLVEKLELALKTLEQKSVKKNSSNSSLPPSSDIAPKIKSLRERSARPVGGQPGHTGHTLEMKSNPDVIIDLKSAFCEKCGASIENAPHVVVGKRQVVDFPPCTPIHTEYRQHACECPNCNNIQKTAFPSRVNAPVQYGPRIMAMVVYLSVFQYIPYRRLKNMFTHVFNLSLSEGTLNNLLRGATEKAKPVYEQIKAEILASSVIGSDETSCKVNGKKFWMWIWQNVKNTFIVASPNRGFATIDAQFKDGFANAVLVSDRWAAQLKAVAKNHQLCMAHLMRDCLFLIELEKINKFAVDMLALINQALALRKKLIETGSPADKEHPQAQSVEKQLNELLIWTLDPKTHPETITFQKSILKHRAYIFPFLYDLDIPPDNNGSERGIRNIKVKQKISGQFKSGQDDFCVLRSVIDTLIKRKLNVFEMLNEIMKEPE